MATVVSAAAFWLYRFGLYGTVSDGRRFCCTETWLSLDPEVTGWDVIDEIPRLATRYILPFGEDGPFDFGSVEAIYERLFPKRELIRPLSLTPSSFSRPLNPNAPEAGLRLQRVGAEGDGSKLGRLTFPIQSDDLFTDLPHRRHVDADALQALLVLGNDDFPLTWVGDARTYQSVIFHRASWTWTAVDHYVVKPNPVRIWQRWKQYDYVNRHVDDEHFVVPEVPK